MSLDDTAAINLFVSGTEKQLAFRRLPFVPRVGDTIVLAETRYTVVGVEWCLDEGATERGVLVNIALVE